MDLYVTVLWYEICTFGIYVPFLLWKIDVYITSGFLFLGLLFNVVMDITKWCFGVITCRIVCGCVYISIFMIGGKYFLGFMCIFMQWKIGMYITSDFYTHFGVMNTYHIFFHHDQVWFFWDCVMFDSIFFPQWRFSACGFFHPEIWISWQV